MNSDLNSTSDNIKTRSFINSLTNYNDTSAAYGTGRKRRKREVGEPHPNAGLEVNLSFKYLIKFI
jgi:hypothetical protein